jgi:hypothetical protein
VWWFRGLLVLVVLVVAVAERYRAEDVRLLAFLALIQFILRSAVRD